VQDRVEFDLPDPVNVTLFGTREQDRPAIVELVRLIVPLFPFRDTVVIVELAVEPGLATTVPGVATSLKSGIGSTWTVTTTKWTSEPTVPVTLTWKSPIVAPEIVALELPGAVTLFEGLKVTVRLGSNWAVVARTTVPVNPCSTLTLISVTAELDPAKLTVDGLAVMIKSWTVNVTIAECFNEPLVAFTNTV
jgi:hypothetical protein